MRRTLLFLLAGLLFIPSVALSQDTSTPAAVQSGSETIAAVVNGETITKDTLSAVAALNQIFEVVFTQLPQSFGQALLSTPEGTAFLDRYQRDVLDQLIDSRLLVQQAKEREIEVDESNVTEQVEGRLDQIMQQNQLTLDEVADILEQQGSSLDEYKENLGSSVREQLMVQGLQEKIIQDATVTDEQIKSYYDEHTSEYTDADGTITPLEDVRDEIHDSLLKKAQSDLWNAWFTKAKDEADIQILF